MTSTRALWSSLQGVMCVYKPAELSITSLKKILTRRIVADCDEIVGSRKPRTIKVPIIEEHPRSGALLVIGEKEQWDYSEHPLVVGEMLRPEDLRIEELLFMEATSSGICLFGLNDGCDTLPSVLEKGWPSEYRIEGILGRQTRDNEMKSRVTLKSDYSHITKHKMQKLLVKLQSNYRRAAFETAEVDLRSEQAFDMARKGIPRTKLHGAQIFYSIDVTLFQPPLFALNISCTGENDQFIRNFVNEVGMGLGSVASPIRIIRRGIGPFRPNHALLEKQITLQNAVRNISMCNRLLSSNSSSSSVIFTSETDEFSDDLQREVIDGLGINQKGSQYDAMRLAWPRDYN